MHGCKSILKDRAYGATQISLVKPDYTKARVIPLFLPTSTSNTEYYTLFFRALYFAPSPDGI